VPFSVFMDEALYGVDGFYTRGGGAGRRRDFITSPEVGPLFGAVLARVLDRWWDELGRPSPFMVAECGAGPGTLCRDILRARPACAGELRYLLVDVAEPMRALHRTHRLPLVEPSELFGSVSVDDDGDHVVARGQGPLVASVSSLPDEPLHVVLANELLDNLPFDIAQRVDDRWHEVRVGLDPSERFRPLRVELDEPRSALLNGLAPTVSVGRTLPLQHAAAAWIAHARASLAPRGRLVAIDYGASLASLASRDGAWLRTYRGHERGIDPFAEAGSCDITADVAIDFVGHAHPPSRVTTQAEFLTESGIGELVDEARRTWTERAAVGDLEALAARSRIGEADALLDPTGLGAFVVAEWVSEKSRF
jgi:SAM-dependent MidA family methyltransferase